MRPELVVLDFAGTTLQDDGAVLAAYRQALTEHDIPFSDDDLAARRGASKRAVFEELAARSHPAGAVPAVADRALASFQSALHDAYTSGPIHEIPGAGETVRQLRHAGIRVTLTSGFDRRLMDLLVGRLDWDALFDLTVAADEVPAGRPAPFMIYRSMIDLNVHDVRRVAVVGDTPLDLQAATNARAAWVVGVLSGAHGIETLGFTSHTHLLPDVAVLPRLFDLAR